MSSSCVIFDCCHCGLVHQKVDGKKHRHVDLERDLSPGLGFSPLA